MSYLLSVYQTYINIPVDLCFYLSDVPLYSEVIEQFAEGTIAPTDFTVIVAELAVDHDADTQRDMMRSISMNMS